MGEPGYQSKAWLSAVSVGLFRLSCSVITEDKIKSWSVEIKFVSHLCSSDLTINLHFFRK